MSKRETSIKTGNEIWDSFVPVIKEFLSHDKSHFVINGRKVSGYRSPDTDPIWLRDHTHQMKGFKYFDPDMTSALDIFREYQFEDGAFFDFFVHSEKQTEPGKELPKAEDRFTFDAKNQVQFARCGVEADVEYLAVESVYQTWQATGDDDWMRGMLDSLEKGLNYSLTSDERWSEEYGLIKRPFTIDTWDFEYGEFQEIDGRKVHASCIRGDHFWCIMHGDNTGVAHSCGLLARMFEHIGDNDRATKWQQKSDYLARRTNEVCWNGMFYTHQVHLTDVEVDADEAEQLSLSNSYDLNRGVPSHDQCVSIIREYQRRRELHPDDLAEWYAIDPPFKNYAFGHNFAPGEYVNGGVMPLVGGELAHGALQHGFEAYGVDILKRYYELAIKPKETYLWYRPDGSHLSGGSFLATDGWGSAAMLYAVMEGLAGIEDTSKLFETVRVSPKWAAAGEKRAEVTAAYEASGAYFTYVYEQGESSISVKTEGTGKTADFHVLLPANILPESVTTDGKAASFDIIRIENSVYVDFTAAVGINIVIECSRA